MKKGVGNRHLCELIYRGGVVGVLIASMRRKAAVLRRPRGRSSIMRMRKRRPGPGPWWFTKKVVGDGVDYHSSYVFL
jgi:hypothetical protein